MPGWFRVKIDTVNEARWHKRLYDVTVYALTPMSAVVSVLASTSHPRPDGELLILDCGRYAFSVEPAPEPIRLDDCGDIDI